MVWKILRPHYWILDRRVRGTNRFVVAALILLPLFGGQWIHDNLLRDNLALLSSEKAAVAIASALPVGLFLLLLFAMLGVSDMMHQLYLASDLELLMVAPVPYRTIFSVKLLQSSRATFIPAFGFGAFLVVLGLAQEAAAIYYLLVLLLILAAMILATAAVMILVILLARLLQAQKVRSWMPVVIALATFTLMLSQQSATQWFLGQTDLITSLAEALLNSGQLSLVVVGIGTLALATSLIAYQIFNASFHEGWNRFREVPTQRIPSSTTSRPPGRLSRLVQPLPAPLRHFLIKEWLELRRNPRGLITLAQPLVLVVAVLVPFLKSAKGAETLQPLTFWFMLAMMMLFLSMLPLGTSLMVIAQEGRKMVLLRSVPISMSEVLKGKFWSSWMPTAFSWVLVFLIAGIWMQFHPWQIGLAVAMIMWGLAGASVATMAIAGVKVDFTAEELKQRIPRATSYLMMAVNLVFVLLTMVALVWLMIQLIPDSPALLAIQALSGYPLIGWIFSTNLLIPLALLSGQVAFWVGGKVIWDAAVRRLESWEEV